MRAASERESTSSVWRTCVRIGRLVGALALALAGPAVAQESNRVTHPQAVPTPQAKASAPGTNGGALPPSSHTVIDDLGLLARATNSVKQTTESAKQVEDFPARLELARSSRLSRQFSVATAIYAGLLQSDAPESLRRTALIEMALTAQDENDLVRAQQIYAQGIALWPLDPGLPEIILRQGLVYRQMGLNNLAIAKFYTVMTSALTLRPDRFEYYQQLVLRAQNEIANAQYDLGSWTEAADSLGRLLKLDTPPENHSTLQCKLIRCLIAQGRHGDACAQAQDFLTRHADAKERPEVHFLCASSLKQIGRGADSLQQVLSLLKEQHGEGTRDPAALAYWQRRAGNEIANQFYQEGEHLKAMDIYLSLAALGSTPEWQLPVWYQLGLVYERMSQPAKAIEYYENIGRRETEMTNAAPSLKAVLEMARWRKEFIAWRVKSESANLEFRDTIGDSAIIKTSSVPAAPIQSKAPSQ